MTKLKQIYKCGVCGNIIEVLHVGAESLVCCDQPMEMVSEKNKDEGLEKHLPVIEKTENGVKVTVGSVPHPMEEGHFIEWIEIVADGKNCRQFLKPNQPPEVEFETKAKKITTREYCNLHGLWKKI